MNKKILIMCCIMMLILIGCSSNGISKDSKTSSDVAQKPSEAISGMETSPSVNEAGTEDSTAFMPITHYDAVNTDASEAYISVSSTATTFNDKHSWKYYPSGCSVTLGEKNWADFVNGVTDFVEIKYYNKDKQFDTIELKRTEDGKLTCSTDLTRQWLEEDENFALWEYDSVSMCVKDGVNMYFLVKDADSFHLLETGQFNESMGVYLFSI